MVARVVTSSWVPTTAAAVFVLVILGRDVAPSDLVRLVFYLAVAVALPGVFVWRLLLQRLHDDRDPPLTWFEDLSLGSIFGFGIQLPFYLVGVWIGHPRLFWVLPVLVVIVSVTPYGRGIWTLPTDRVDPRVAWALAVIVVYGMTWLARNRFLVRPLTLPPHRPPAVDETFHLALVAELTHRFPPEIPFLLGTRLDYHWFVHAQLATMRWATGVDSTVLRLEPLPALLLVLSALGLGAVALRLTGRAVAAVIAPGLLIAGAFHLFGPHYDPSVYTEPYLSDRFVSSPSQTYGVMVSLPALMLILEVLRPDRRAARSTWVTLAAALLALSGSKATFLPIFLCGAVAVCLLQLFSGRRIERRAMALTAMIAAATAFAQVVLFGGQGGSMAFAPLATVERALVTQQIDVTPLSMVAMAAALLVGWLLYGIGVVGLVESGRGRDPRVVWMLVCIPAGITVALLFYRSGLSQLWFQRSVAELVALASAWGLACLLPEPLLGRRALGLSVLAGCAGLAAFTVSRYVELNGDGSPFPTLGSLLLTAAVPLVVLVVFLLTGLSSSVVLVAFLLGLGLSNVIAVGYDIGSGRPVQAVSPRPLFAAGGERAAAYLERKSSTDAILATNAHCMEPDESLCNNHHFWISAYTERRVVIEGWGYTAPTNANYDPDRRNAFIPVPYPKRLAINDAAFKEPSAETLRRLIDTYDVSWLFVDLHYPADVAGLSGLPQLLTERYRNANYVVFRVVG